MNLAPVLLTAFNRPDETVRCIRSIIEAGATRLFVSIDGPRTGNSDDQRMQDLIVAGIQRECLDRIHLEFRIDEENLGCRKAMFKGIDWFFDQVESGIIVEDDILISSSFLRIATEYLQEYGNNKAIWQINGWSPFLKNETRDESFYLSRFPLCWGWATWRDRWRSRIAQMPQPKRSEIASLVRSPRNPHQETEYWINCFDHLPELDTWDYDWVYSIWRSSGYVVAPPFRLTENIGFGPNATHTRSHVRRQSSVSRRKRNLRFKLNILPDTEMDEIIDSIMFSRSIDFQRIILILRKMRFPKSLYAIHEILFYKAKVRVKRILELFEGNRNKSANRQKG